MPSEQGRRARWPAVLAALIAQVFLLLPTALAGEGDRVLRVGQNSFRPFIFAEPDGAAAGYSVDVLRLLAERAGYELQFVPAHDLTELLAMLERGEIDMTAILAETPERKKLGRFTAPLGSFANHIVVQEGSEITRAADLGGRRVGFVADSGSARTAFSVEGIVHVPYEQQRDVLFALLAGSIDAAIVATEAFMAEAKEIRIDHRLAVIEPPLSDRPRGFIVRHGLPQVVRDLDLVIDENFSRAEEQAIHRRWFGEEGLGRERVWVGWVAAVVVLLGLLGFAFWIGQRLRRRAERLEDALTHNLHVADALEHLDVTVIIYDEDLHPIYWNPATERYVPAQVALLKQHKTFTEILAQSRLHGPFLPKMTEDEAMAFAQEITDRLRAGEEIHRSFKTTDGRSIEAYEARVASGIYASVRTNVTLTAKQAELIEAQKADLEEANKQLEGFVHIAAHDLRAPLRHAKNAVTWLRDDIGETYGDLPEELADSLDMLETSCRRMSDLVEDLLTYALSGKNAELPQDIDLETSLAAIIDLAGLPKDAEVSHRFDVPRITAARTAFEIVLRNLISNAAKHHDRGNARIDVRAFPEDGAIVFEVEDDGPGIPEEFREAIFEPFKRLKSKDEVEGTGLGLSFIKRTVEAWGGTVSVSCPNERGSVFRFTLPAETVGDERQAA